MSFKVPFIRPQEHYRRIKEEVDFAITDTLAKGDLVMRRQLRDFEQNLAEFVGTKFAVGLNSGYHALAFSLLGAGVGPGDEVITVAHTFVATISAIVHSGATPVLVDVDPDSNMDADAFEAAITPRTKAVIPVHLNGRMAPMDRIVDISERHGIKIIEDACQALGAHYRGMRSGAIGAAGCFSFYPFKALGGLGDGGAITTNDPHIARMATLLRYNGEDRQTGEYHYHGYTALLDNVQAAVLDVKLRHFPKWIEHRRNTASLYRSKLQDVEGLQLPHWGDESYHYETFQNYVVRTRERDALRQYLRENGVETLVHWQKPVWEHKALGLPEQSLPETEKICREVISLPMSAETSAEDVDFVAEMVTSFFATKQSNVIRLAAV